MQTLVILMNFREIVEATRSGKYLVWIDDKQNGDLTPEYIEQHFVTLVDSAEEGREFCGRLHEEERNAYGKAITRYRISRGKGEDYTSLEDLSAEDMARIAEGLPMSPEDRERVIRDLKS